MQKSEKTIFFSIICLGCMVRLFDFITASAIELDGIGYAQMAGSFAKGAIFEGLKGISHPLYPVFLGGFSFFVKDLEIAGRIVSFIFGILLIYFTFLFLKKYFGEKKALYGAFFVAIHPYLVRYSVQVLSESMTTCLFAAAVCFFYKGWKEEDKTSIGLSGVFLALTYLNKAEYIIYALPFCFLLVKEKRFSHICILLACIALFAFPYVYYLKLETGLWTITKKVGVAESLVNNEIVAYTYKYPFESSLQLLRRFPFVVYNFFEAIFPPLFILAVLGFKRVEPSYRMLSIVLVVLHIIARVVFAPHSTKRYSVEFIPVLMVFSIEGMYVLKEFFERYRHKNQLYYTVFTVIIVASIFQGITLQNKGRAFHKQAGLFLLETDPGNKIISRLPVVPFYAKGEYINISALKEVKDCSQWAGFTRKTGAKYLVFDDRLVNNPLFQDGCLTGFKLVVEFKDKSEFVKIYRLNDG